MDTGHVNKIERSLKAVVIGAGFSGILMGYRLQQAGIEYTIFEKNAGVGGTWWDNSYPGLHCDIASQQYCYSFDLIPDWTHPFSSGDQILDYCTQSSKRLGVFPKIRLNTKVAAGRWTGQDWIVSLDNGEEVTADILISAAGILHVPAYPDIPGLDSFEGIKFHTARWDRSVSLEDKRIGIIGTGSTAVQIVTALAGKVKHLTLFQRTPQWVAKIPNDPFTPQQLQEFRDNPDLLKKIYDEAVVNNSVLTVGAVMGKDPAARQGLKDNVLSNLATVRDPELRRKLTPDYEVGCKRLVMSPGFYEAIQQPGTAVVTERIKRVEPQGIRTADGTLHELDLLAIATGFDVNAYLRPVKLSGRNGRSLDDVWAERPIAYHSITVPDMPNFFMLEGPFSPIGNLSVILISEWQADYVMRCIEIIRRDDVALSPTEQATAALIKRYRDEARYTIWSREVGGCQSWYQDDEGVPVIYPFTPHEFRDETSADLDLADFLVESLAEVAPNAAAE